MRTTIALSSFLLFAAACGRDPDPRPISVLTIDLHQDQDFWPDRFPLVADEIVRLRPDFVAAQEVKIDLEQPAVLARMVRDRDPTLIYDYQQIRRTGAYEVTGEGLAIFSRHTIAASTSHDLGEGRVALFARLRLTDALTVDLYDVHLDELAEEAVRKREVRTLLDFVADNGRGTLSLLAGDFVSTPGGAAVLELTSGDWLDTWAEANGTPNGGHTTPIVLSETPVTQMPTRRSDYVFLRRPVGDASITIATSSVALDVPNVHGLYPSDHLGVLTTLVVDLATLH